MAQFTRCNLCTSVDLSRDTRTMWAQLPDVCHGDLGTGAGGGGGGGEGGNEDGMCNILSDSNCD